MKQVLITLRLTVPEDQEPPTSEEISEELDNLFRIPATDDWHFLGYDISLAEIQDKTSS